MINDERDFATKLTAHLDAGTANLKAGTAYKLQLARHDALARLADPTRSTAMHLTAALAGAGGGIGTAGAGGGRGFRPWLKLGVGVLLIVAVSVGYQQWQAYQQLTDLEETDAGILSSDLPIDAYLDRGFQNWLKHDAH